MSTSPGVILVVVSFLVGGVVGATIATAAVDSNRRYRAWKRKVRGAAAVIGLVGWSALVAGAVGTLLIMNAR